MFYKRMSAGRLAPLTRVSIPRPDPVKWTKDGLELSDMGRVSVEGRELTFTSLNKTDNGTYRCEASNHLGTSSAEYLLYVYGEFRGQSGTKELWSLS